MAYDIVPRDDDDDDDTADGHVMVDFASTLLLIDEEPRKGSFRPHW